MSVQAKNTPSSKPEPYGQLAGEYRILRKLGSGGFGAVYEAEHPVLRRKAAVKVLHPERTESNSAAARFLEEARSASRIRHRNVVDIFSFGTLPTGQLFYVMDLLEGAPLDRYLQEFGRFEVSAALSLLRQVAAALEALHGAGMVHRDVKPGNLFLTWDFNDDVVVKLLDFGLIKLLGDSAGQTASGVPIGTPHYMSPEQCRGEKIDARADVYAFGVICYELFTGDVPIHGDSVASILVAQLLQTPRPMSEALPDLPAALDAPVARMLEKSAEARPATVAEAFASLERAARSADIPVSDAPLRLPHPTLTRAEPPSPSTDSPPITGELSGARPVVTDATRVDAPRWHAAAARVGVALVLVLIGVLVYVGARLSPAPEAAPSASALSRASAAPVASAPSPEPSSVAPPAPATVALTVTGAPAGAAVFAGDEQLGVAPGPLAVPRGSEPLRLRVVARGYAPKTIDVVPDRARELRVDLARVKPSRARDATVPRDLENPF